MMELDEIKRSVESSHINYSRAEIEDIFRIRTRRSLSKLNSKMLWDAVLMFCSVVVLVVATFLIGLEDRYLISMEITGLAVLLYIHYRIKYYLLNRFNFDIDIKTSAQKTVKRLSIYLNVYKLLIPVGITGLYLKTQYDLATVIEWGTSEMLLRFGLVAPLLLLSFIVTKKLISLLYQHHLDELGHMINDLTNSLEQ